MTKNKPNARNRALLATAKKYNGWWPGLFDKKNIKPLAIGIDRALLDDAQARNLPLTLEAIKAFLYAWTRYHRYLKASLNAEHRYGLNGNTSPPATAQELRWVRAMLDGIERAAAARNEAATA